VVNGYFGLLDFASPTALTDTGGGVALQIQLWGILAPLGEWLFLRIVGKVRQWLVEFYFG